MPNPTDCSAICPTSDAHEMSDAASAAFAQLEPCPAPGCEDGRIFGEDPCERCGGTGRVPPQTYVSVLIPWEPDPKKRTEWHPTRPDFAPITRGAFYGKVSGPFHAHRWAREHLGPNARYELREYETGW